MSDRNSVRITVHVTANARKSQAVGFSDGVWKMKVAAVPAEGKANAELVRYIANVLGIPKSNVAVEHGGASRVKVVSLAGINASEAEKRLNAALEAQ